MTQWTKEQYEDLSIRIADKFHGESYHLPTVGHWDIHHEGETHWLHKDWHSIMELCIKYGIETAAYGTYVYAIGTNGIPIAECFYVDHNNDKSLSDRVARMLALMEVQM